MSGAPRILVVDDEEAIVDLTRMVLVAGGYDVVTAPSGWDALRTLRGGGFDLVLLDINMPGMDGWETLRLLKSDGAIRDVPVAMFSIKNEFRDRIHGMQEGAVEFITKPFEMDDLLARVRRVLENREATDPSRSHSLPAR